MGQIIRCFCLVGLVCYGGSAQEPNPFAETPGTYTFKLDAEPLRAYRLDLAGRESARATVQQLNDIFRAAPVMNPPLGFEARSLGRAFVNRSTCPNENCTASAVVSQLWLQLYYFVKSREGKPVTGDELNVVLTAYTNWAGSTVTQRHQMSFDGIADMSGNMMYFEPRRTRTLGGFPVFDDDVVVVTKSHRPFWLPVSRETYLRAAMRDMRKAIAGIAMPGSDLDRGLRSRLGFLQAELDALSPAQRASQAWLLGSGASEDSGLAVPDAPDARPLIIVNPDFLDRSLPRTAVQMVAVRLNWGTYLDEETRAIDTITADDHVGVRRLWELLNQTDWTKLAAMVAPPAR